MERNTLRAFTLSLLGTMILFWPATRCSAENRDPNQIFEKTEVMLPMRDGIHLHTQIYLPKGARDPLPILLTRTPYGLREDQQGFNPTLSHGYQELVEEGYIFVFQDIRGRYKSEGRFIMLRPPVHLTDPKAVDESTDTYDTIEWLLKNVPSNNGRVGVLGISYPGWLVVMAMIDPHPAVKAVSEQASPSDPFIGHDFYENGAFRLSGAMEYVAEMEKSNIVTPFEFDKYDKFEWYLDLGPPSNIDRKYLQGKFPTWNAFMTHPYYDEYWRSIAVPPFIDKPTVPDLNVAGWWDQEDFYGPIDIYETLEKKDTRGWNYLVIGPWYHGGWSSEQEGRRLGNIDFGSDTSRYFREKIQAPWFAYWLKNKGNLDFPEALIFETGTDRWKSYAEWPPRRKVSERNLYFHSSGRLSFDPPQQDGPEAFDSYVSDPARPVPYMPRPITVTNPPTWLVQDERFAHLRPDVLDYETEPLTENVTVAGSIIAHLFASTTGTDSDWVVKLMDVIPEDYPKDPKLGGYQLMIGGEMLRAKFRRSLTKPEPVAPNRVIEYTIDLHAHDHCFLKGHRIMVQVQSTWFPLIDRNPQKFVENIFKTTESDYQKATQRVYRSGRFPSHLSLPVATP